MAAITPTSVYRESLGSLTLLIVNLTTGSTSDTYTIAANSPVVSWWAQSATGSAYSDPDITWTASTGVFLMTNPSSNYGNEILYILMRT